MKGWAEGARSEILNKHILGYSDAVECSYKAEEDFLHMVLGEYYHIVSWRLKDHEEPPQPWPFFNPATYASEELTEEEAREKSEVKEKMNKVSFQNCKALIHQHNVQQIKWYLHYHIRKLNKKRLCMHQDHVNDPYTIFLMQLAGITKLPKACQAYQEWMVQNVDAVAAETKKWWDKAMLEGAIGRPGARVCMGVARGLFAKLPKVQQAEWKVKAKETAEGNKCKYQNALKAPPSKDPQGAPVVSGSH